MVKLQFYLHNGASLILHLARRRRPIQRLACSTRAAPAPLAQRINLSKWRLYEMPKSLVAYAAAKPVKPVMDTLKVPKANVSCSQLDVKFDPSVMAAAVASLERRGGFYAAGAYLLERVKPSDYTRLPAHSR